MTSAALIPDRRRSHFPLNGGPRPTGAQQHAARTGIAAARDMLKATVTPPTAVPVVRQLSAEQIRRARHGIAKARQALQALQAAPGKGQQRPGTAA